MALRGSPRSKGSSSIGSGAVAPASAPPAMKHMGPGYPAAWRRLARTALILTLLSPGCGLADAPVSSLALTVRIPVAPLLSAIEAQVPHEVRQDRGWRKHDGVRVRYAARRAPLQLYPRGDALTVRALVGYWVQARKDLLGRIPIRGSCGIDEPSRGVLLTLVTRLELRPDWRLASHTSVLPPRFLNPCRMTFAGLDVTGAVSRALYERLWRAARDEIDQEVPRLADLRAAGQAAWERLRIPIQVEDGVWLDLDPTSVWATQPVADATAVRLVVGLTARPRLTDVEPGTAMKPLPTLQLKPPVAPRLALPLRLALSWEDAQRMLGARLEDTPLRWGGRQVTLQDIRLAADGDALAVDATLSGDIAGTLRLIGTPAYDSETGEIYLDGVDYALGTENPNLRRLDRGFHEIIRAAVEQRARWPLRERMDRWRGRVEQALTGALPPPFTLRTRLTGAHPTALGVTDEAIILEGILEGEADVELQ